MEDKRLIILEAQSPQEDNCNRSNLRLHQPVLIYFDPSTTLLTGTIEDGDR